MGLEKAIRSGKERRKEYHGAKAVDSACRNNGGCPYCESNRLYVNRKRLIAAEEQFRECEFERKIFSKEAFRDEYNIGELNPRKNPYTSKVKVTIEVDGSTADQSAFAGYSEKWL